MLRLFLLFLFFILFLLAPGGVAPPAEAAEIHVWADSENEQDPYSTHGTASKTLVKALAKAKAGDVVLVHGKCKDKTPGSLKFVPCVYNEAVRIPCGVTLSGRADETRDKTDHWRPKIDGKGLKQSVLRGGPCVLEGGQIRIEHLLVRNGEATLGGGIRIIDARALIVDNCIISNRAERGGGIAIVQTNPKYGPSVIEKNFIGGSRPPNANSAAVEGAGIYVRGTYFPAEIGYPQDRSERYTPASKDYHVLLRENIVQNNKITGKADAYVGGGGLSIFQARVWAEKNLFYKNRAEVGNIAGGGSVFEDDGGAVYIRNFDENNFEKYVRFLLGDYRPQEPGQYFSIRNIYRENRAGRAGGAVAAIGWASLHFEGDRFEGNRATSHGGAVYTSLRVDIRLQDNLLTGRVMTPEGWTHDTARWGVARTGGGLYISCGSRLWMRGNLIEHLTTAAESAKSGSGKGFQLQGGAGVYIRNSTATLEQNVLQHNLARSPNADTPTWGGGFLGIELNKTELLPFELYWQDFFHPMELAFRKARQEGEALICNQPVQFELLQNQFLQDGAIKGGAIAILLRGNADDSRIFSGSERPTIKNNTIQLSRAGGGIHYEEFNGMADTFAEGLHSTRKGTAEITGNAVMMNDGDGVRIVERQELLMKTFSRNRDGYHKGKMMELAVFEGIGVHENQITQNTGNGVVVVGAVSTHITRNLILGNLRNQIGLDAPKMVPSIRLNRIDGEALARNRGVLVTNYEKVFDPGFPRITANDIVNHGIGARNTGGPDVAMPHNWWGAKAGPPASGANHVEGAVAWRRPAATPIRFTPPAAPGLPSPSLPNPRKPLEPACEHVEEEPDDRAGQPPPREKVGRLVSPPPIGEEKKKKEGALCPKPPAHDPIRVGKNAEVGSGAELKSKVEGLVGGIVGGALGGLLGGAPVGPGGPGPAKEPELKDDPIADAAKRAAADPATGARLLAGALLGPEGLLVSSKIADAPGGGTFQAVFLEDARCRRLGPSRYDIYAVYADWVLTVHWTYDRWVNGRHVEHRQGGWAKEGRDLLGLLTVPPGGDGVWKRLGFDRAVKGIQSLGTAFRVTEKELRETPASLVVHVTRPEEDPVTTVPFIYDIVPQPGGKVTLVPASRTVGARSGLVGGDVSPSSRTLR